MSVVLQEKVTRTYIEEIGIPVTLQTQRPDISLDQATILVARDQKGQSPKLFLPSNLEKMLEEDGYQLGGRESEKKLFFGVADSQDIRKLTEWQKEAFEDKYFLSLIERLMVVASARDFGPDSVKVSPLWVLDAAVDALKEAGCICPEVLSQADRAPLFLAKTEFNKCVLPRYRQQIGAGFGELEAARLLEISKNRTCLRYSGSFLFLGTYQDTLEQTQEPTGWEFTAAAYAAPRGECVVSPGLVGSYFALTDINHQQGVEAPASAFRIGERQRGNLSKYTWIVSEFTDRFLRTGYLSAKSAETWVKVTKTPPGGGIFFEQ